MLQIGTPCTILDWRNYDDLDVIQPEYNIVAILIDVHSTSGVLWIHNEADDYMDRVGRDFRGYRVIVPWQTGLKFVCYGSCRVALVRQTTPEEDQASQREAGENTLNEEDETTETAST